MLDARNIVTRRYSRHTAQDNCVCVGQERVNARTWDPQVCLRSFIQDETWMGCVCGTATVIVGNARNRYQSTSNLPLFDLE